MKQSSNTSKRYLLIDIEADGLDPKNIWVVVTKDYQTNEVRTWLSPKGLKDYMEGMVLVGHNILWFDIPVLNRLWGLSIDPEQCLDTLVFSRLFNSWDYSRHSLSDWGTRLGVLKSDFSDWSHLSDEMIEYCKQDVEVEHKLFDFFYKYIHDERFIRANEIEHRAAIICTEMHYNGFGFDVQEAKRLHSRIESELSLLTVDIQTAFPPRKVLSRTILPRPTKSGTIHKGDFRWITDGRSPEEHGYHVGVPVHLYDTIEFNPASPKQCIERLNEFGWKPTEKTKGHVKCERDLKWARGKERKDLLDKLEQYALTGWTISEENLDTLPNDAPPAAQSLVRWILLDRRLTTLNEWIGWYNEETGRIHGEVRAIGTWTHRAAHKNPNTGNIARVSSEFGGEMRALWRAGTGYRQVGCDAEGIQLRILAHYMDDYEFTKALVSGKSDDGTDVHTLNWKKLGHACKDRTTAKTFIYSYLLGAGVGKTAQIFQCTEAEAREAREKFVSAFPGLSLLKNELIPSDAARGWFEGLDGRPVMCDSEHLMLAGYLQNGESIVMKYANWLWRQQLRKEKVPFWQMNYVHDEWQTRTVDDEDVANYIGKVQAQSIVQAGIDLGVKCPLAGKSIIGYNWRDTH